MLLTFTRRPATPSGNSEEKDVYFKRCWRREQHLADVSWKRWLLEYVLTLQPRSNCIREKESARKENIILLTRTRSAVTGHSDHSSDCTKATIATFDQLAFIVKENNLLIQFLRYSLSSSTTDVTCLFFVNFFLLNVCSVNI